MIFYSFCFRLLSETFTNYNGTNPRTEHFTATTIDGVPVYLQRLSFFIFMFGFNCYMFV